MLSFENDREEKAWEQGKHTNTRAMWVYSTCPRCYHFSKLGVNEELSYQELRDLLAAKKAERFMTEVVALRNRIDTLMANHSKYIAV